MPAFAASVRPLFLPVAANILAVFGPLVVPGRRHLQGLAFWLVVYNPHFLPGEGSRSETNINKPPEMAGHLAVWVLVTS